MALRMHVSIRVRVNSRPCPSRTQTRLLPWCGRPRSWWGTHEMATSPRRSWVWRLILCDIWSTNVAASWRRLNALRHIFRRLWHGPSYLLGVRRGSGARYLPRSCFGLFFLHIGAWRLRSKDLGCGARQAAFLYRHGPVLAGQCRKSARSVASGVFCGSNAGSPKLGGPVLDYFPVTTHSRP